LKRGRAWEMIRLDIGRHRRTSTMTGRELLLRAIEGQEVERIPWVPFSGVHSASLIDIEATAFLKSADSVVRGQGEVVRRYRPDGIPVVFDLQVEAEVLGCELKWADDNPPAVVSHPLCRRSSPRSSPM
jgi:uroporphyrinogen decarboxylase